MDSLRLDRLLHSHNLRWDSRVRLRDRRVSFRRLVDHRRLSRPPTIRSPDQLPFVRFHRRRESLDRRRSLRMTKWCSRRREAREQERERAQEVQQVGRRRLGRFGRKRKLRRRHLLPIVSLSFGIARASHIFVLTLREDRCRSTICIARSFRFGPTRRVSTCVSSSRRCSSLVLEGMAEEPLSFRNEARDLSSFSQHDGLEMILSHHTSRHRTAAFRSANESKFVKRGTTLSFVQCCRMCFALWRR